MSLLTRVFFHPYEFFCVLPYTLLCLRAFRLLYPCPQAHENRIYMVNIVAGPDYPIVPPTVQFSSKVNLTGVNPSNGKVDAKSMLPNWNRDMGIETFLVAIRQRMASGSERSKAQPPEGSMY